MSKTRKPEELKIVTRLLDKHNLTYDTVATPNHNARFGRFKDHYTVYIPSEKEFSFLISFDDPFEGYRCAKKGEFNKRYDTYIDALEPFVATVANAMRRRAR